MPLRVLDLRCTPPPYEDLLPRPEAPGAEVHAAVAAILADVRAEGDAALLRYSEAFDRDYGRWDRLQNRQCPVKP